MAPSWSAGAGSARQQCAGAFKGPDQAPSVVPESEPLRHLLMLPHQRQSEGFSHPRQPAQIHFAYPCSEPLAALLLLGKWHACGTTSDASGIDSNHSQLPVGIAQKPGVQYFTLMTCKRRSSSLTSKG